MSLQTTPKGDRVHITIYGKTNAGKSSLLNALTGQTLAIVSDTRGTTTDPVYKAMEILPLGPCMLIDTPGLDDEGELGRQRIEKALQVMVKTDIALLIVDISSLKKEDLQSEYGVSGKEQEILVLLKEKKIPYLIILNQADKMKFVDVEQIRSMIAKKNPDSSVVAVSTINGTGIEELKDALATLQPEQDNRLHIIDDLVEEGDMVLLVVPIDEAAPKGRLILPQQQVIRDLLDSRAVAVVTQVSELEQCFKRFGELIKLVITDSQAFKEVSEIVPAQIPLTSFSILFARHKGDLQKLVSGVRRIEKLQDGDRILIAEGCTHRRQCGDIGTVKIPMWLKKYSEKEFLTDSCSGTEFPADLSAYKLVIHCGGCSLNEKEMKHRIYLAESQGVPVVNYGILIAYLNGILQRSVEVFPDIYHTLTEAKCRKQK